MRTIFYETSRRVDKKTTRLPVNSSTHESMSERGGMLHFLFGYLLSVYDIYAVR